jgi:hypothetical protein
VRASIYQAFINFTRICSSDYDYQKTGSKSNARALANDDTGGIADFGSRGTCLSCTESNIKMADDLATSSKRGSPAVVS